MAANKKAAPGSQPGTAQNSTFHNSNYRTRHAPKRGLDRTRLPAAPDYYRSIFGELRPNGEGWAQVRCCFHEDNRPSLSVHTGRGAFTCFACGAKGGDLIDFVMRRDGLDFKGACKSLGAWR